MPNVELTRRECRGDLLPPVCMECGLAADTTVRRDFRSVWPIVLIFLVFFCSVVGIAIAVFLLITHRVTATVPMCHRHRRHWAIRHAVVWTGVFGLILVTSGWMAYDDIVGRPPPGPPRPNATPWLEIARVTSIFVMSIAFLLTLAFQATGIHVARIQPRFVRFRGVHPNFIVALEAERRKRGVHDIQNEEYGDERDDFDDEAMTRRRQGRGRFEDPGEGPF